MEGNSFFLLILALGVIISASFLQGSNSMKMKMMGTWKKRRVLMRESQRKLFSQNVTIRLVTRSLLRSSKTKSFNSNRKR